MKALYIFLILIPFWLFSHSLIASEDNFNLPKGIVYQIVIETNDIPISNQIINQYYYPMRLIVGKKDKKTFQFGNYKNYSEVDSVVLLLIDLGCTTVDVNAYLNGYNIPIPDAIASQYKVEIDAYVKSTKRNTENVYLIEVNYLVNVKQSKLKHYYALAILVKEEKDVEKLLEKLTNEQILFLDGEDQIFSIGKYESFDDVIEARKYFINNNINDVFIMAQFVDPRISVEDNKALEYAIKPVVKTLASKL